MFKRSALVFSLFSVVVLVGGCARVQHKELSHNRKVQPVRARSADAFFEMNTTEHDMPLRAKEWNKERDFEQVYNAKPVNQVPINPSPSKPSWVGSQVHMSGYYVGIGVATHKVDEAESWAHARNNAYVELASTIKLHITSAITDYFKENNLRLYQDNDLTEDVSRTDSSYAQESQFFVDQTLDGVEIYDRWKDVEEKKYWILVRLSKDELARRIRAQLEKARTKALDYVRSAVRAESQGHIREAFKGYFNSFLALRKYFGGVIEYDINEDNVPDVLNHEIERGVARLAEALDWYVENTNYNAVIGTSLAEPLVAKVYYKDKPVSNLPIEFSFVRGTGTIERNVTTDNNGVATARVLKVFGQDHAIVVARVDVEALVQGTYEAKQVETEFSNDLNINNLKFFIELEKISAYIDIDERAFSDVVKDLLHKKAGFVFTHHRAEADIEIRGWAQVDECSDFYQQRMCSVYVSISVFDCVSDHQLFTKAYKAKGIGTNDREAKDMAFHKSCARIVEKIIQDTHFTR